MNLIYVIRHGQSTVNVERRLTCRHLEGDLTVLGREQALKAAQWLSDKNITNIVNSPFHRTVQTAQIIAEKLGVACTETDDLREMDCGDFESKSDKASWDAWRVIYERWLQGDWKATYPGGESYRQGFDRFNHCLMSIKDGERPLLVTHGGISTSVIPYLCVNAAALQGSRILDNTGIVVLEPYGDGRYICRAWNQTEHL